MLINTINRLVLPQPVSLTSKHRKKITWQELYFLEIILISIRNLLKQSHISVFGTEHKVNGAWDCASLRDACHSLNFRQNSGSDRHLLITYLICLQLLLHRIPAIYFYHV